MLSLIVSLVILWSACGVMCFGGGVALESDYAERVGSYAVKASLLLLPLPTFRNRLPNFEVSLT